MLGFFADNIVVRFGGHIFQQISGIPIETKWGPSSYWAYAKTHKPK